MTCLTARSYVTPSLFAIQMIPRGRPLMSGAGDTASTVSLQPSQVGCPPMRTTAVEGGCVESHARHPMRAPTGPRDSRTPQKPMSNNFYEKQSLGRGSVGEHGPGTANGLTHLGRDPNEALHFLDPGCDRDEWVKIAMAAKAAGIGFETFDAWSASAPNYTARDTRDLWKSIKTQGGVGAGTLFWMAGQAGLRPGGGTTSRVTTRPAARPVAEGLEKGAVPSAAEVWSRCVPATASHGYIDAKNGQPEGLRVVPDGDPLTIAGLSMAGALVVPITPLNSCEPVSLQFIATPKMALAWKDAGLPSKLNLPGAPVSGVYVVGQIESGGTAYLCEGVGQAWTCWQATGRASVACFGWNRVRAVAAELRVHAPAAQLVLVPDVGKEAEAEEIARRVGALVANMPSGWDKNSDVNDLGLRDGNDEVENMLNQARKPNAAEERFKPLGSAEIHELPSLMWRVRGVLPASGVACVYGPSGSGKSFLTFDMAAAIAVGGVWFDHRITPCPVVYVCQEGAAGVRQRVKAWEQHHRRHLPANLKVILDSFKLTSPDDIADLGRMVLSLGSGAVTIVDTLNASAPGIDENSSRDMGSVIEATKTLQRMTAGLVVLVHHTGKDRTAGMRGHSSLVAALDAAIEVTRDVKGREWRLSKAKDGAEGARHPFSLEEVSLEADSDGEPVTSCVVKQDASAVEVKQAVSDVKVPSGGNQRLVYDRIRTEFAVCISSRPGVPAFRPVLDLEMAVSLGAAALPCPTDKRTSRARDAISGLVRRRVLGLHEGVLWIP